MPSLTTLALLAQLTAPAPASAPADTCRFDLPGPLYQNPDAPAQARPMFSREAVDSLGLYAGWLFLAPGQVVPEHTHDADELLWAVCGSARLRVGDQELSLAPGIQVRIPAGTPHAALLGPEGLVAAQVYRPGTAGLRFFDWQRVSPP